MPRELDSDSAMWQGLEALFPSTTTMVQKVKDRDGKVVETPRFLVPATVDWAAAISNTMDSPLTDRDVNLESVGMVLGSNRSVVDEVIADHLVFPAALLDAKHRKWRIEARQWATLADQVSRALATFAGQLAEAAGAEDTEGLRNRARQSFLTNAEPYYRKPLHVAGTDACPDIQHVKKRWRSTLWKLADQLRSDLVDEFGPSALIGIQKSIGGSESSFRISAGSAERWLARRLRELLYTPESKTEEPSSHTERNKQ